MPQFSIFVNELEKKITLVRKEEALFSDMRRELAIFLNFFSNRCNLLNCMPFSFFFF